MDFAKHVFISYAHIDNQPLSPQQQGWVTRFHITFEALLSMRLGRQARIWRDDKLAGTDAFSDEIVKQFGQTALMVSVLTPRYIESTWCTRELREFCEQAERGGGLVLENKSRVLKVMKVPLDNEALLPQAVRDVLGYAFFVVEDGAPLELDAAYGETFAQDYNRRVCKLAWDAAQLLKRLEAAPDAGTGAAGGAPVVYLATVSHDCQPGRERVEAELLRRGCTVLPDRRLPLEDEAQCLQLVEGWLARASLAVQLVGCTGGPAPDGPRGQSVVALQNRLAAERSREAGLPRLVWLPEGTTAEQPAQQALIRALHEDDQAQSGADLMTGNLDRLIEAVHATLDRLAEAAKAPPPASVGTIADPGPATVYLVCTGADRKASVPLRRYLRDQGLAVELPAFDGEAAAVRETNRRLLEDCDAVLLYYGAGDEQWKRSVDIDLRKSRGLSQRANPAPVFTYLAAPRSADKDDLTEMQEPGVIDGIGNGDGAAEGATPVLPEAALAPMLGSLRAQLATR